MLCCGGGHNKHTVPYFMILSACQIRELFFSDNSVDNHVLDVCSLDHVKS